MTKLTQSKFHFIGIGGIGMCGLAELLHNMGAQVTGSDLSSNANTEHLQKIGVTVYKGHQAENVSNVDVIVYSSAVKSDNPEVIIGRKNKIPLIPRAEALAEIMRLKRGIAVAGTHGKTTTTSLVSSIFISAQKDPTVVVGGRFDLIKSTAVLGKGNWLIAEADESDGSFHKLSPEIAIITNIDNDHLDYFKNFENLQKSFLEFALRLPFYGTAVVCGDDPKVRDLFAHYPKLVIFYGFDSSNDLVLKGQQGQYEIFENGKLLSNFRINFPGKHNALNALAAIAAARAAGIELEKCVQGVQAFEGVDRRFQFKGEASHIKVYDDYGHHPTEVSAALQGFKEKFPKNRIVVYFQPHRFSRTQDCWGDFLKCFKDADVLLLGDIYPAGEKPIEGITSQALFEDIQHSDKLLFPWGERNLSDLKAVLKPGDVFVTLGAGDGWKMGMELLKN